VTLVKMSNYVSDCSMSKRNRYVSNLSAYRKVHISQSGLWFGSRLCRRQRWSQLQSVFHLSCLYCVCFTVTQTNYYTAFLSLDVINQIFLQFIQGGPKKRGHSVI